MGIIPSLLDNDAYKWNMAQVVYEYCPTAIGIYKFKIRNPEVLKGKGHELIGRINHELDELCELRYKNDEIEYLGTQQHLKPFWIDYLKKLQLDRGHINVTETPDGNFDIIAKGPVIATTWFEVPTMSIVSEAYTDSLGEFKGSMDIEGRKRFMEKIGYVKSKLHRDMIHLFNLADFGGRRRRSFEWQEEIIRLCIKHFSECFVGTSNMYFAKKYGIKAIGTMAHEYVMIWQAIVKLINSQKHAFDMWARCFRGDLGIALTDTLGFDAFLRDFDLYFAKLFDGGRHDSNDPYAWCEKFIKHFEFLNIDPLTKKAIFSDGLNMILAVDLFLKFYQRIQTSFGMGTFLTNDCGITPLQIVMKLIEVNGQPVAKESDDPGKSMCEDDSYRRRIREVFQIEDS